MPFHVYVLKSEKTQRLYIGQTNDLQRRIGEHQRGKHPATRNRGPWKLLFAVPCRTRQEAVALELKLKRMKRPDRIISYLTKLSDAQHA